MIRFVVSKKDNVALFITGRSFVYTRLEKCGSPQVPDNGTITVSYTHLDVYKRQVLQKFAIIKTLGNLMLITNVIK